jgi:CheY-like chemotaxis protein
LRFTGTLLATNECFGSGKGAGSISLTAGAAMQTQELVAPARIKSEFPNRVLVVDDNHDAADSTALLLRVCGFEAHSCYTGLDALQEAQVYRPHICLLDLNMPGMDGDELALRLREQARRRRLVLVALTAMSGEECSRRIQAAGFDLHLVKPVDPFKLVELVDTLFAAWSARALPASPDSHPLPDDE